MMLGGHFNTANGFSHMVATLATQNLPQMLRHLWWTTRQTMLPIPGKVHYVFNMRDLSRIVQVL